MYVQDNFKVNVCLLIGLGWLDKHGKYLSDAQRADMQAHIQTWTQEVVTPLRSLRRLLKQPIADYPHDETQTQIRAAIKQAELLAEKKLLLDIEAWSQRIIATQDADITPSLDKYLSELGVSRDVIALLQRNF